MALPAGQRLGVYEVTGFLGAGGMGEVYEARDTRLGRTVALKLLPAEVARDAERLARLEHEARAVAALNHPSIVTLFSVEDAAGVPFLVMERVYGRPLSELIEPGGLPLGRILELATPVAEALAAAHEQGVVHRDLKPANVMVGDDGRVKVLDFGLAKLGAPATGPVDSVAGTEALTREGQVLGTVPYMAPEQLRGEPVDARADMFSFGAILYEMASGHRPFRGASAADVTSEILTKDPPPVEAAHPGLPTAFSRVVRRCLEKDPRRRIQSAADLAQELHDLSDELRSVPARPPAASRPALDGAAAPDPVRRRWPRPVLAALVVAAVGVVVGAAGFLISRIRSAEREAPQTGRVQSIAVLPFENLGHDPSQDYFVDGMHDALITELAKLGTMRVTSRSSVMRYKGHPEPIKKVAGELGVDAVIEGSVLHAGDRVRITAQLIRGSTDEHLWADSYDRDLRDVLGLLGDVSHSIAREVRAQVAGGVGPVPPTPAAAHRVNPQAWDAYLRGRKIILENLTTAADLSKALPLFEEAVALDPGFSRGWSALATVTFLQGFFGRVPLSEALPKAREMALKALALDSESGEAETILGTIELYVDWDFDSASARLQRALTLVPHDLLARHAWADYLRVTGRLEESFAQTKLALRDNPTSPLAHGVVLFHEMATRRWEDVIADARRTLAVFPKLAMARGILGDALWEQGKYDEALAEYRAQAGPDTSASVDLIEKELRRAGPKAALKALADRDAARSRNPYGVAGLYAAAGDHDAAFAWLEKAYVERTPQLLHVVGAPEFDGLRDDPRYADLLRRIGIPLARGS